MTTEYVKLDDVLIEIDNLYQDYDEWYAIGDSEWAGYIKITDLKQRLKNLAKKQENKNEQRK